MYAPGLRLCVSSVLFSAYIIQITKTVTNTWLIRYSLCCLVDYVYLLFKCTKVSVGDGFRVFVYTSPPPHPLRWLCPSPSNPEPPWVNTPPSKGLRSGTDVFAHATEGVLRGVKVLRESWQQSANWWSPTSPNTVSMKSLLCSRKQGDRLFCSKVGLLNWLVVGEEFILRGTGRQQSIADIEA